MEEVLGKLAALKHDMEVRLRPILANAREECKLTHEKMVDIFGDLEGSEFEHDAQALLNLLFLIDDEMDTVVSRASVTPDQTADLINFVHG
jgi:hypothetical protein